MAGGQWWGGGGGQGERGVGGDGRRAPALAPSSEWVQMFETAANDERENNRDGVPRVGATEVWGRTHFRDSSLWSVLLVAACVLCKLKRFAQ